eukprot:TRINITY_DN11435_c0_g1_i10.p2 TRINITY_DN11435_c0_g1~~TRINITY_DN11435_c0_g1_i10.p2  ORF type:complete len:194 (+),score=20.01 TRINITY_DN11435_c0_g1_i10:2290-2871(+)
MLRACLYHGHDVHSIGCARICFDDGAFLDGPRDGTNNFFMHVAAQLTHCGSPLQPNTRPLHAACSSTSPNAPATIELLIALGAEAIGEYNRNLPRLPIVKEAHVRWLQSHLWVAGDCWRVELSGRWASSLRYRKELNQTMTTAPLLLACLQACIPMVDKDADLDTAAPWSQIIKWDYLVHRASHDEHHHDDIT